jgi:hypothetical protein
MKFDLKAEEMIVNVPLPSQARAGEAITIIFATTNVAKPCDESDSSDARLLATKLLWMVAS